MKATHWFPSSIIVGGDGADRQVEFLVDTGYDGYLLLPTEIISELALTDMGEVSDVTIAGGERRDWAIYRAEVSWGGQLRNVEVLESDNPPLLGMAMLDDAETGIADRLTIDAADRSVLIEHSQP